MIRLHYLGSYVPNQCAHTLLRATLRVGERIQLVHQSLRVNPAQRVPADGELPGIIAEHHRIV